MGFCCFTTLFTANLSNTQNGVCYVAVGPPNGLQTLSLTSLLCFRRVWFHARVTDTPAQGVCDFDVAKRGFYRNDQPIQKMFGFPMFLQTFLEFLPRHRSDSHFWRRPLVGRNAGPAMLGSAAGLSQADVQTMKFRIWFPDRCHKLVFWIRRHGHKQWVDGRRGRSKQ